MNNSREFYAQEKAKQCEQHHPKKAPQQIKKRKFLKTDFCNTRKDRCKSSDYRKKAAKNKGHTAIFFKEVFGHVNVTLFKEKGVFAVKQPSAGAAPKPIAYIIAQYAGQKQGGQ